jgi:mannose-P-dolichol utilization defect protein 1
MDALRSVIQPITHNLPKPIADLGIWLIGDKCYKTLLLDIDPSHTECLKLAVSKGLGIGIIGASSIVKVPQLLKLINSQSADGLSFLSYLLESSAYLISLSYNVRRGFPFSTYGETALILIQNIAIASLVLQYSGNSLGIAGWIGGLGVAGTALFNESWVGDERLSLLQATAGVLGVAAKVPQILTIWSEGGTGQLSAFAVSLTYFLRCLACSFGGLCADFMRWSSTTSSALSRASSRRCKKLTTRLFYMASLLALPLTLYFSCRSCTTGMRPRQRTPRVRSCSERLTLAARQASFSPTRIQVVLLVQLLQLLACEKLFSS